jgi:hypothetical protein
MQTNTATQTVQPVQALALTETKKEVLAGCGVKVEWSTSKPTSSNNIVYNGQVFRDDIGLGTSHMVTFAVENNFTGYLNYTINSSNDTESQSLSDTAAIHMNVNRTCY